MIRHGGQTAVVKAEIGCGTIRTGRFTEAENDFVARIWPSMISNIQRPAQRDSQSRDPS